MSTNLVPFQSWPDVLAYAQSGQPLYYSAPMDRYPARLMPGGNAPFTYKAQARTIKIWPAGSVGRGRNRTSDPFTADAGHLDRFSRPAEGGMSEAARHREPVDEHAANELVMYIENTSDLSPDGPSGQGRSVLLNALRKWRKGTYDPELAVRLFGYLADAGAKRYQKEFGSDSPIFSPATRHEAAKQLEASFRSSVENGEYDHVDTRIGRETREKEIPYDDDDATPEGEARDNRWVQIYDDEAIELLPGWTGGQSDPLYAISSSGGGNYAWVFEDAIANIDSDLARVKKLGRNKFQLGRGTFTKKEIDELHTIRQAMSDALYEVTGEMHEQAQRVADFNSLEDLVAHAGRELGATHVVFNGDKTQAWIYFPRGGEYPYEEARTWRKGGYWHAEGPGSREGVKRLPNGAKPIDGHSRRAAAPRVARAPRSAHHHLPRRIR